MCIRDRLELRAVIGLGGDGTVNVMLHHREAVLFRIGGAFTNLAFDGFFSLTISRIAGSYTHLRSKGAAPSGAADPMHGFCTVGVVIGILCMGWNYFEMRGKFCIKSTEPDGAAPVSYTHLRSI